MIWDAQSGRDGDESALASYLKAEIGATCGDGQLADSVLVDEMAKAVEHFLLHEKHDACVEPAALVVMASQALAGLGQQGAARRLLLFGTGLVRVSEWEVTGGQSIWVLDLRRMVARCEPTLEIAFFNALNIVLDAVAEFWDESGGVGLLGLRNVSATAARLLEGRRGDVRVAALAAEILARCRRKLELLGTEREWRETPRVLELDL